MEPEGFNYTVQISPSGAAGALVDWQDPRAVENKNDDADGYVGGGAADCTVTVQDFCLTEAHEVSAGRWAFNFTIRAQMNSVCGSLNTHLAVSDTTGAFLGAVEVANNDIIDSFSCDCVKDFMVEADYSGALPAEFVGQLYISDSNHDTVLITDSCTLEVTA